MRAIVNTGPGRLELRELPRPEPGAGQALIRTTFCGVCATDLQMIAGWDRTGFPSVPGHEWTGVVAGVGPGGDAGLVGRPCVAENVLSDGGEVGFEHPGGYGEYFLTEARNVLPLPAGFDLASGALVEPLAVCVHALDRLARPVGADEPVLVIGDGAIGLLLTALLAERGCRDLTLVGGRPGRIALAERFGAARTLNYHDLGTPLAAGILSALGAKLPLIFEASGAASAMDATLELVERLGTIVEIGDYGEGRATFLWNLILHQEPTILGSNASAGAWPEAVRVAPRLPLGLLVSRRVPAERFADAMALTRGRDPSIVKVVLEW